MYRPDRILLKNNTATVIDYKFGEEEHTAHHRQLQRYAELLRRMDYTEINSYLYYVSLGKLIEC